MQRMPVLFMGHGSPMNAIEDNRFTKNWKEAARKIPVPKAILVISAHWYTSGIRITDVQKPRMVYDMYGFPDALYRVEYGAPGSPELADQTKRLIGGDVLIDNSWGLDHGAWSLLCRMYPDADVPVCQLSVNRDAPPQAHFDIGRKISVLREQGILILGSGNVVHNLSRVDWNMEGGFPWAESFDGYVKEKILAGDFEDVVSYEKAGRDARLSVPTPDHFFPLLEVLGAVNPAIDDVSVFNDSGVLGSLSMTCYRFGQEARPS